MRRSILFIYLFVILFSKFFFILLDYETDDEAKGLLDDSEENGKNNWTTTTITLRDILRTPSVKTQASVFISVRFLMSVFHVSCSMWVEYKSGTTGKLPPKAKLDSL